MTTPVPEPPLPDVDLPPGYRMTALGPEHRDAIIDVTTWAFASDIPPEVAAALPFPLEPGRGVGIWAPEPGPDGAPRLAASHSSYAFEVFGVPGGTLPTAGLTWVAVHPQHRRRGLARAMVLTHLHRTRARREPLSALFAAEPEIYGRFGYGCAAMSTRLALPRGTRLRDVPGTERLRVVLERVDPERHGALVADVHGAGVRPGWAPRTNAANAARVVADIPAWRHGAEGLRIATVLDQAGAVRAYAVFARTEHWNVRNMPEGTVRVRESVTLDAAAARVLWGALTDLDLMVSVETAILAVDDPLLHLLVNGRTAAPTPTDNVWVRVVDLPAALAGRRYACDVDVVLEVSDALLPENAGRWRVRGGLDGAEVVPVDEEPDIALDVRELGSAYLGGVTLGALAGAGLVREHTPGALARASTAFGWPMAPVCGWVF